MMFKLAALIALSAWIPEVANAREIAVCGESEGHSFYPKLGLSSANEDRWIPDRITGGRITLTETSKGEHDIFYANATGAAGSAKNDGAMVTTLGSVGDSLGVLVAYPDTGQIESYAFIVNADGKAEVMWTVNRYGPLVRKVSAFKANCSFFTP